MKRKLKVLALIPALWASIIDTIFTIAGQSKDYWDGNLNMANEGNPIGDFMMRNHVSGIFVVCGVWIILIGVLGYYLPRKIARVFLLFVLIAHSWGASTWMLTKYGFWFVLLFILFNSILFYRIDDKINNKRI